MQIDFTSYNDLLHEIEILETQIYLIEKERDQWWLWGRLFNTVPLDNAAKRTDKIGEQLERMKVALDDRKQAKNIIEECMNSFTGVEYKVAYKRFIECKSLKEIAEELNFSYDWVRKISQRVNKAQRRHKVPVNM